MSALRSAYTVPRGSTPTSSATVLALSWKLCNILIFVISEEHKNNSVLELEQEDLQSLLNRTLYYQFVQFDRGAILRHHVIRPEIFGSQLLAAL